MRSRAAGASSPRSCDGEPVREVRAHGDDGRAHGDDAPVRDRDDGGEPSGRGRRVRTDSPAGTVRFGHCPWNGLVAAVTNANGIVTAYEYDIMNRMTNIAWRTASGSRLGGFAYRYDALGRIVSRAHDLGGASFDRDYAYDDMDRLASDGGVIYAYDALGRRVTTTNAKGTERHVYDDNWQVIADLDEGGNVIRSYVWGEGIDMD